MQRLLVIFLLVLLLGVPLFAQSPEVVLDAFGVRINFAAIAGTGTTGWVDITNYATATHLLTYSVAGTASAVSVAFDCSDDAGVTTGLSLAGNDPKGGRLYIPDARCTHIRGRVLTDTGGTAIRFNYRGVPLGRPPCNAVRKTNCQN